MSELNEGAGTNKIATEDEVKSKIGSSGSTTANKCCTKSRAIELGVPDNTLTDYDDNQLVKYEDIHVPQVNFRYQNYTDGKPFSNHDKADQVDLIVVLSVNGYDAINKPLTKDSDYIIKLDPNIPNILPSSGTVNYELYLSQRGAKNIRATVALATLSGLFTSQVYNVNDEILEVSNGKVILQAPGAVQEIKLNIVNLVI